MAITAIPDDFRRVGYENGTIPDCALSPVPGIPNIKLHPQAAEQLAELFRKALEDNVTFTVGSAYRTVDTQVQTKYKQGRGAASPGKSNHGWGTAIDISELYSLAESTAYNLNKNLPDNQKLDKFSPAVHEYIRKTSRLYQWLSTNAPLYGWVNPGWAKDGKGSIDECWHWEYQAWPQLPSTVPPENRPKKAKPVTSPCGPNVPPRTTYARYPTGAKPPTSSISPYLGTLDSFHPNIQYELTKRRVARETANTYMPFVKLTSLMSVYGQNIAGGVTDTKPAWCPTLGPHGEDFVSFEDIYRPDIYRPQNNRSIVGYVTTEVSQGSEETKPIRVPLLVEENSTDPQKIPMPGIVEMDLERGTAGPMGVRGGLMRANIKIFAYSVGQVDTLLRYFLRPATRVVLEMGRKSSTPTEKINYYDWSTSREVIANDFIALINNQEAQQKFIEKYVYGNNGNYEIFIGYVVKFDLKYNKNNVYEIMLTIHSVQQFEIPTIQTGVKSFCSNAVDKCRAMDIREYFDDSYSWKQNSFKKLMGVEEFKAAPDNPDKSKKDEWSDDFFAIRNPTTDDHTAGSKEAGLDENEYYVSWNFFVGKILNDPDFGLISVIPEDTNTTTTSTPLSAKELLRLGLLRPVKSVSKTELEESSTQIVANEVGYHPDLRSIDPNVMIIYNTAAQSRLDQSEKQNFQNVLAKAVTTSDEEYTRFINNSYFTQFISGSSVGKFENLESDQNQAGRASLLNGVWINTKAIKQAFSSTDTVTTALSSLLSMMNAATQGYWNLQLYSADRLHSGLFVIDAGLSKKIKKTTNKKTDIQTPSKFPWIDEEEDISPSRIINTTTGDIDKTRYRKSDSEPNKPAYIYMFNRKTKVSPELELGSDLLDLNVEFNLPQVIAVQAIAGVGGPAQKSTLQSIKVNELQELSLIPRLFTTCSKDSICKNEECTDRSDLSSLKARFEGIQTQFNTQLASTGGNSGSAEMIQLKQNLDGARNDYYRAEVQRAYGSPMVVDTARELSSLGTLLQFIEFNPAAMMKKLNLDSMNAEEKRVIPSTHAFNSSNLTKTIVTVTLPGIGGIELLQSFVVDRVPSILKTGYYVVTKVTHKFTPSNGWITTIEGRFRYRPTEEDDTTPKDYDVPCGPSSTIGGSPSSPTTEGAGGTPSIIPPFTQNDSVYLNTVPTASNQVLIIRLDLLEKSTTRPSFGRIATKEDWDRRVKNGEVARDQIRLEAVKAELRKRIKEIRQRGAMLPRELRGLSESRLRTNNIVSSGTF